MSDAEHEGSVLVPPKNRDENAIRELAARIREVAYQLHVYLGTGYLEKVYENALKHRLEKAGLRVRQQVPIRVHDEDGFLVGFYEADLVVNDCMLINFGSEKFEITKRVYGVSHLPSIQPSA